MSLFAKVNGTWKVVSNPTVKVNNAWKQIPQIFVNINGVWKPLFTFTWEQGAWSSCSATCGGGTQTRTVRCKRDDGTYWPDSVCSTAGTKPSTSQSCNTQACGPTCHYIASESSATYWQLGYQSTNYNCTTASINNARIVVNNVIIGSPAVSATSYSKNGITYTRGAQRYSGMQNGACLWRYEVCY